MKKITVITAGILATGLLSASAHQPGRAPTPAAEAKQSPLDVRAAAEERTNLEDPAERINEVHAEIEQVSQRIAETYQKAMKDKKVEEALGQYEEVLHKEMINLAPEMEEAIEQRLEMVKELREIGDPGDLEMEDRLAFQDKLAQHQQLQQQLAPVEMQARHEEEVAERHQKYQQFLLAEMQEINPQTEQLLERRNEAIEKFQTLQQQMIEQQQGQEGGAEQSSNDGARAPSGPRPAQN